MARYYRTWNGFREDEERSTGSDYAGDIGVFDLLTGKIRPIEFNTITLTDGDDYELGTLGHDTIHGGDGDDYIHGGGRHRSSKILRPEGELGKGYERETKYEEFGGHDTIHGGKGDDHIVGGDGKDRLYGNEGDDNLYGGVGDDLLKGGKGDDKLSGGIGHDRLHGGYGHDHLYGGKGDDKLDGEQGHDTLWGGAGKDTFVFTSRQRNGDDTIADFEDGKDKISFEVFAHGNTHLYVSGKETTSFDDLTVIRKGNDTVISHRDTIARIWRGGFCRECGFGYEA